MRATSKNLWNFWKQPNTLVLVTTNNVCSSYGNLVMGAGVALQAKYKIPELPQLMSKYCGQDYGLVVFPEYSIGCLQTKRHWKDKSPPDLVQFSLQTLALTAHVHSNWLFYLPKPGCGMGGLDWESEVAPICWKILPDNCIVCL